MARPCLETDINRSPSVNYLYNKRQFDLRRSQKGFDQIYHKNHIGFTTEDIDDIYMPNRLNQFESKLKASLDISDNSEQEEMKNRKHHLKSLVQRQSEYHNRFNKNNSNKRYKQDTSHGPKFTISLHKDIGTENYYHSKHSYTEEAKRKINTNNISKAYYYNLNNKLKSSVANVMKATQDLGRSSELRQMKIRNASSNSGKIRSNQGKYLNTYTSDDIDSVYMPWMIENYGRKLVIEALKRRGNMNNQNQMDPITSQVFESRRKQNHIHQKNNIKLTMNRQSSQYVSQYYAQSNVKLDHNPGIRRNDLWLIDKEIRRLLKRSKSSEANANDTEVSISDSETSSDDTRPIVPEKINKPDISLKNKILKTINKSLLSSELSGINLTMLKLNDHVHKTLKRIEKNALERDLEFDLIHSFSCNHLNDLRREDIKYMNQKKSKQNRK